MSTSAFDDFDEYKCQSCGQVPICLNSTESGHEVCDECLPLFIAKVCPLLACKIPSHLTYKIRLIKENLEISESSHEKTLREVFGQIESILDNLDDLSVSFSGIETKLNNIKTEANKDIREMRLEMSDKTKSRDDFGSKIKGLMAKFHSLKERSRALDEKMKDQSEDYKNFKINNDKSNGGNLELKENIKTIEKDLEEIGSSVKLNTKELKEKMFLMDHSIPQLDPLEMNCFNVSTQYGQIRPVLTWKVKEIKEKMELKMYEEWSDWFNWTGYPVRAKSKLEVKKDDQLVRVSMCVEDTSNTNEDDVMVLPSVYYLLKSRNPNETDPHIVKRSSYSFPCKFNVAMSFEEVLHHKSWLTDPSYNEDDSVTIEVYVESPSMARQVHSRDGVLRWVIKDCEKRQLFENDFLIDYQESPYFYTGPNGYRVQVMLRLNGFKEFVGKGPSASIQFLQGEYDDDLPGSFPHRTTVTLSNPKDPRRRVVKTIEQDIVSETSGYVVDICELNELARLIVDGTLYVRVDIVQAVL